MIILDIFLKSLVPMSQTSTNGPSNFCPICWGRICVKPPNFFPWCQSPPDGKSLQFSPWLSPRRGLEDLDPRCLPASFREWESPVKGRISPISAHIPTYITTIYILCIVSYYNIIEIHIRSVPFVFCETWWFPNHGFAGYMWKFKGLLLCEK